jgi:hypothetical protein
MLSRPGKHLHRPEADAWMSQNLLRRLALLECHRNTHSSLYSVHVAKGRRTKARSVCVSPGKLLISADERGEVIRQRILDALFM